MHKIVGVAVLAFSLKPYFGVAGGPVPWFANLPASADPATVSKRITDQFLRTSPARYCPPGFKGRKWFGEDGNRIQYAVVSLWVNALECADMRGDTNAVERLVRLYDDYLPGGSKAQYASRPYHVDDSIFGSLPYQVYLQNGDRRCLAEGNRYADIQWSEPNENTVRERHALPEEVQWQYWKQGFTPQTRLWIDDMYMIIALQSQAYRATGDRKYIERAANEMCLYLDKLQLKEGPSKGLFYHAPDVKYVWGRGDGWMAAGMALVLRYLSEDNPKRTRILEGYRLMMESLLRYQRADGKWCQLVDRPGDPRNWAESSCTAMFAYAFMMGSRFGWLPVETYGPAARKAWIALCGWLDEHGNLPDVCCGTGKENDLQYYFDRQRIVGDPHGQAPMLWCARTLMEAKGVTIHMAGDSTMARYDHARDPYMFGWGERLQRFCRAGVRVRDCAASGRSLQTFRAEKRWERLLSAVSPGDFVIIQFGHNDEKFAYDYEGRKGIGASASLKLYCDNLRDYIGDVKKRSAHPVVVTSIVRLIPGKDGSLDQRTSLRAYCDAAIKVAKETDVPVVDLGEFSRTQVNAIGCAAAEKYYMLSVEPQKRDRSHLTELGADVYTGWFVGLAKAAGIPMGKLFR